MKRISLSYGVVKKKKKKISGGKGFDISKQKSEP